jgi:hypothetical protein
MSELKILRIPDRYTALGIAAHFLARREVFTKFGFGELVTTIDGQIERAHYRFVFAGSKLVGYVGYAVYAAADARAFAETGAPPPFDRATGSDVLWVLTLAVTEDAALDLIHRTLSREFAGKRVMAIRQKADGQRHFVNIRIRDRQASRKPGA